MHLGERSKSFWILSQLLVKLTQTRFRGFLDKVQRLFVQCRACIRVTGGHQETKFWRGFKNCEWKVRSDYWTSPLGISSTCIDPWSSFMVVKFIEAFAVYRPRHISTQGFSQLGQAIWIFGRIFLLGFCAASILAPSRCHPSCQRETGTSFDQAFEPDIDYVTNDMFGQEFFTEAVGRMGFAQ